MMMKKSCKSLLMLGMTIVLNQSYAQEMGFNYGTRLAIGEATLLEANLDDVSSKLFVGFGVGSEYRFNKVVSLMGDFLITKKGGVGQGFTTSSSSGILGGQSVNYSYIEEVDILDLEIPIMLRLGYGTNDFTVGAFAGPGINFNLVGVSSRTYDNDNFNEDNGYSGQELAKKEITEYGLTYGAGISITAPKGNIFYLDIRKNIGLSDVGEINGKAIRTEYFAVSIAYTL
jgi:opacity protein-like surface antigen